jgi:hypothetical protein
MSIGEGDDRPDGRRTSMAAQIVIAAALGIMLIALLLAAASVQAAAAWQIPEPIAETPTTPVLVLREPKGQLVQLAAEKSEILAEVNPATARIQMRHRFRAGPGELRDGVVLLPLPADARPLRLRLAIGPRRIEADLTVEAGEAGAPALAVPVTAVPAHAEIAVEVTYARAVTLGENRFVLSVPLAAADRAAARLGAAAWQEAMASSPLAIELDPGLPLAELRSPSHGIDIARRTGERRRIVLADSEPMDGRDFVLVWSPADPSAALGALRRYAAHTTAKAAPQTQGALALRARRLGEVQALVPVSAGMGPLLDSGGVLTTLAARSATAGLSEAAAPAPLVAGLLLLWGVGALYLVTRRRGAKGF